MDAAVHPISAAYSTAVDGGAIIRVRYAISGRIEMASYLSFVAERAAWLNISGWAEAIDARSLTLVAAGPEALVGALEMAFTLGPLTALVETVEATAEAGPVAQTFTIRSSPGFPA